MNQLSDQQYRQAFMWWFRGFPEKQTDLEIIPFLSYKIRGYSHSGGWLQRARKASFFSTGHISDRLKISRSAYSKFEQREKEGLITLKKLAELADAMDCELVYAIRPKSRIRFSQRLWKRLLPISIEHSWVRTRSPIKKPNALAAVATRTMAQAEFRQQHHWTKRTQS